ncbi:Na+/H+ antiporter [Clostridia bacterium]|nr:Na+/H+ antiporter [Clostridia bacterium]
MDYGWLSIVPPVIAMILVLITKEVVFSLFIGVFSGALIYDRWNLIYGLRTTFKVLSRGMADMEHVEILVFLGLLGALVVILTVAGGAQAYGDWAVKKIKTKRQSQLMTFVCGLLFFIDDFFHFLAASVIMKPVMERNKISPEKFAYLLDSTAATTSVIAPISSWAVVIISLLTQSGVENSMGVFMKAIPFNLYAVLTILTVLFFSVSKFELGGMAAAEKRAERRSVTGKTTGTTNEEVEGIAINKNGKIIYMILPICVLVFGAILWMLGTGGFFTSSASAFEAIRKARMTESLIVGSFFAILAAFCFVVPTKVVNLKVFMEAFVAGVKTMMTAILILILAWAMGSICDHGYLNTGIFVKEVLGSSISAHFFPVIMFLVACLLSFATGTSWATFGIFIPVAVNLCKGLPENVLAISVAATLAGSVFGDHVSPISGTTVMASTGTDCDLLKHVSTQMPYALPVAFASAIGFLVAGFLGNVFVVFGISLVALAGSIYAVKIMLRSRENLEPS